MIEIEVLQQALADEKDAIVRYEKLIGEYPTLKDLFYVLLTEEQKHKAWIEKKIAELK